MGTLLEIHGGAVRHWFGIMSLEFVGVSWMHGKEVLGLVVLDFIDVDWIYSGKVVPCRPTSDAMWPIVAYGTAAGQVSALAKQAWHPG